MQLFSKPVAGLRRQRSLLQKLKRSGHMSAQAAVPRWLRGARSMAVAQDEERVLPGF